MLKIAAQSIASRVCLKQLLSCNFSTFQIPYKPQVPIQENYNTLYVKKSYSKGNVFNSKLFFVFNLPATAMMLHNFMTQWSLSNSFCFITLTAAGTLGYFSYKNIKGWQILCVQVDPELQNYYLTITNTVYNLAFSIKNSASREEIGQLVKSYHPAGKSINYESALSEIQNISKSKNKISDFHYTFMNVESKINRIKIPAKDLSLLLRIDDSKLAELQKDKQNLSAKEMIKKYENVELKVILPFDIQAISDKIQKSKEFNKTEIQNPVLPKQNKKQISLRVFGNQNTQKMYYDYMIAQALGFKIDLSEITKKTSVKSQNQETDDQRIERSSKASEKHE